MIFQPANKISTPEKKPYPVQNWDPPPAMDALGPLDESYGAGEERQLQLGFQNPQ